MNIYLAGSYSRKYLYEMELYLAGEHTVKKGSMNAMSKPLYILESYYYLRTNKWMLQVIGNCKGFLLDSGAFTFMSGGATVDWKNYVDEYAAFIKEHNIKHFFELDIDSIVGIKTVESLRKRLEDKVGMQSIPVWHKSRGKEYYLKMLDEYKYVSIGGIVSGEIKRTEYKYFPYFINKAKEKGVKIHALGFTNLQGLKTYNFDSVDSTAWLYGNRSGLVYRFNGRELEKIKAPKGFNLKSQQVAMHNFNEWIKFQHYAEKNY